MGQWVYWGYLWEYGGGAGYLQVQGDLKDRGISERPTCAGCEFEMPSWGACVHSPPCYWECRESLGAGFLWGLSQHPCRGLWYPGLVHTLPWGTQASSTKGSLQNLLGDAWSIMECSLQPGAKIIFFLLFKFPRVVCYNNKCSFVIFLIESQLDVWGGIDDRWSILSQDLLSMRWFYWHDF